MNHAEDLREKLNQAIQQTVSLRGNYADNFRHFTRNRKMPMEELIKFLLSMTGGTLNRELYDAGIDMATSSFVEQRKRISYGCFHNVMQRFNDLCDDPATLKGYKVWAVDGSTVPLPRNESSKNHYKSDSNPKGWNNTHANLMYSIVDHVFVDVNIGDGEIDSRKAHDEQGALYSLIYRRKFGNKTIVLLDRGYESYSSIYHLSSVSSNLFYVLRVKNDGLRPVRELPLQEELDCDNLRWTVTRRQTNEAKMKNWIYLSTGSIKGKTNSPNTRITRFDFPPNQDTVPMQCRAVRFMLTSGQYETLLTNLPREEFSISDLKELYAMRWKIEINVRFWKYAVGALALHSRTDELILQELYAHLTMFNFCQRICREIEIPQKPGNKYEYKIDMTMAIYLCKKFFRDPNFSGEKLIQDIKRYTQPVRPNRADERNLKVKTFPGFPYRIPS